MHLSALFIYPVKSLRGCAVTASDVDELGLVGDRRFLVVDSAGRFLTQRVLPRMALVATAFAGNALVLSSDGCGSIAVPLRGPAGSAVLRTVAIWKSEGLQAEDCGAEPAAWLTAILGVSCRLVRIGPEFRRPLVKPTARPGDVLAFNDAYPFMAISEASLADLNRHITASGESAVPMDRFRPNLVIANGEPYAEDHWPRIRINSVVLRAAAPCARCVITTTDQKTGARAREPLSTLARYRRDATEPGNVNFGYNFIHETKQGRLRKGDRVTVLPLA